MQDKQRNRRQPPGRFPLSAFRFPPSPTPNPQPPAPARQGFTLTELLIVIAIIAVLAGLIAAAAVNALRAANRSQITLEMKNMSGVVENIKTEFGAYPPNGMSHDGTNVIPATLARVEADYVRMFKKAFQRMNPQEEQVVRALAGVDMTGGSVVIDQKTNETDGGMNAAEAVYFWLGGFSSDPQFPISGPKGPSYDRNGSPTLEDREIRYEFDLTRLRPRDEDGDLDFSAVRYVDYDIELNGDAPADPGYRSDPGEQRRIDLWRYVPKGSEVPLVYFDVSRYKPGIAQGLYDFPASDSNPIYAFKQLKEGVTDVNLGVPPADEFKNIVFVDQGKFQILHCGLDDAWGDFNAMSCVEAGDADSLNLYPSGVFIGDIADTLTSFTDGTIEDEVEQ